MKYRCPYCGEKAFTYSQKLDMIWRNRFLPLGAICPKCKNRSPKNSFLGWFTSAMKGLVLATTVTICIIAFIIENPIMLFSALLLGSLIDIIFFTYFAYFDKLFELQYDVFEIKLDVAKGYWPTIRKGEIYEIAHRNCKDEADYTIAQLHKVKKKKGEMPQLTFRLIRHSDNSEAILSDEVRIYYADKIFSGRITSEVYSVSHDEKKIKKIEYIKARIFSLLDALLVFCLWKHTDQELNTINGIIILLSAVSVMVSLLWGKLIKLEKHFLSKRTKANYLTFLLVLQIAGGLVALAMALYLWIL